MYLIIIVLQSIRSGQVRKKDYNFAIYDTFFGALGGLKLSKKKLVPKPYRVRWISEHKFDI